MTIQDFIAKIAELHTILETTYPHLCSECGGLGGFNEPPTFSHPGGWEDCNCCVGEGQDPLNTNLQLLEGEVSPTLGFALTDPARPKLLMEELEDLENGLDNLFTREDGGKTPTGLIEWKGSSSER